MNLTDIMLFGKTLIDGGSGDVVLQDKIVTPTNTTQTVKADSGYTALNAVTIEGDPDLVPTNIREGVSIFGVEGSMAQGEGKYDAVFLAATDNLTKCNYLFATSTMLTTAPLFDTSAVTIMDYMFNSCTNLTSVPLFDTSAVTSMNYMFNNCTNLTSVPLFDTSAVTNMRCMFYQCYSLTTVPLFDTSNVTDFTEMFSGCRNLTVVSEFSIRNARNVDGMFNSCSALRECWIRDINRDLRVGSGTTYGHNLTVDSLIHLIQECCRNVNDFKRTLTVGSANLEKLANVYVRTIPITDEMRAEDDLIDRKLPFEVCNSTDEGAMLITTYANGKNWTIM